MLQGMRLGFPLIVRIIVPLVPEYCYSHTFKMLIAHKYKFKYKFSYLSLT